MRKNPIGWGRAVLGAILAEMALVAASVAWVAFYSYVLNPNQPLATYQAYANQSGPWVSIIAGIPIFYTVAHRVCRSIPTALVMCGLMLAFDAAVLVLLATDSTSLPLWLIATSYLSKLGASYVGGKLGAVRSK